MPAQPSPITLLPPATETTVGLLDRWCLEVPTSKGTFLVPCPSEEFARGALFVLCSFPPEDWDKLAPPIDPPPATDRGLAAAKAAQPDYEAPHYETPATEAPKPICHARPSWEVFNPPEREPTYVDDKVKAKAKLPDWAPPTWDDVLELSMAERMALFDGLNAVGIIDGAIGFAYERAESSAYGMRQKYAQQLAAGRDVTTPSARARNLAAARVAAQPDYEAPEPVSPATEAPRPYETDSHIETLSKPVTPLFELGRRGMAFVSACKALGLETSKANHAEWKEGQYERALAEV